MNVFGIDPFDKDRVLPVEIRCFVCGASAVFGGGGDAASLDELTNWDDLHKCSRNLAVT